MISYQILSTNSLKEMYGDQSGEFVCGSWGLKDTYYGSCLDFVQTYVITMEFLRQKTGLIADNSLGDEDVKSFPL